MPSADERGRATQRAPVLGAAAKLALAALCALLMGSTFVSCSSNNGELHVAAGSNGDGDDDDDDDDDNDAPSAESFAILVDEDVPTEGSLRARDPDGDTLSFRIVSGPALGDVDLLDAQSGEFVYTAILPGVDSFAYVANDGRRDSNVATVTVEVGEAAAVASVSVALNLATP